MIAAGIAIALAVVALTAQHVYWTRRRDEWVADMETLCDEHRSEVLRIENARDATIDRIASDAIKTRSSLGRARRTVEALTDDLATAHRANTLLRTGILDAEREVMAMAETLGSAS